jgi:hypothetical protein
MQPSSLPATIEPAARERVVEVLSRHFATDVLSMEEFEARVERAYRASSAAELSAITADLPHVAEPASVPSVAENAALQRITATISGHEQRVTGAVPRRMELRSRFGYIELDLTQATFAPGVTEIDIRAFMGYVQIRLPAGVRAECLGSAIAGYFSLKGGAGSGNADAPCIVRITGRAMFGFAECWVTRREARRLPGSQTG